MSERNGPVRAVISDFGGVLTSPLPGVFAAIEDESEIPVEAVGKAMARIAGDDGDHPLFELERGEMTEARFLDRLEVALAEELGRPVALHGFAERYFRLLEPNSEMFDYLRSLRGRGLRLALLTNNVREWEPLWRSMLPIDELFEVVVDSAFVGTRKPDRPIYELTLDQLGLPGEACVFVDDLDVNCETAAALGMRAVQFASTEQAIAEIERALG